MGIRIQQRPPPPYLPTSWAWASSPVPSLHPKNPPCFCFIFSSPHFCLAQHLCALVAVRLLTASAGWHRLWFSTDVHIGQKVVVMRVSCDASLFTRYILTTLTVVLVQAACVSDPRYWSRRTLTSEELPHNLSIILGGCKEKGVQEGWTHQVH